MYWMFSNVLFYFCSILSAEFIRSSLTDAAESDVIILSKAKSRASLLMNGKDDEVRSYLKLLLSLTPLFVVSVILYESCAGDLSIVYHYYVIEGTVTGISSCKM